MSFSSQFNEAGRDIGQLSYVLSPIILTDGIAKNLGGLVPIMLFTETIDFLHGMIAGGFQGQLNIPSLDTFWCHWKQANNGPAASNTLIENKIPQNPFTNISTAGDAFTNNVAKISMQMMCPARGPGAMVSKLGTIMTLQRILVKHNTLGGRYIILTPGTVWTDMLLLKLSDITPNPEKVPASLYQFDFQRPISNKSDAQTVGDNLKKNIAVKQVA